MGDFKIYVVIPSYEPNTATTNRIMAFLHGFSDLGINTHVAFLVSDAHGSIVQETMPHIVFNYLWRGKAIKNRFLNKVQLEINSIKYVKSLPKGASVFLPWPSSRLLNRLVKRRDVKVFYEETELPELYTMKSFSMKSYLNSINKLNGLFVISTSLKDYFISKGVAEDRIQIINMIVDTTRFDKVQKNIQQDDVYIAYCGNSSNSKDGVDDLIKSFALVAKKHPYCKLYIGGIVPIKRDYDYNLSLIKQLGIQEKVFLCGKVPYAKMPQLLKNARILALDRPLTEQAKYGFPTKLGEYLSTGNVVVVTKVGDIPLFLKDGENALLAEPKNENEFAEKICWALEHPSESIKIGNNGKQVAMECFNYLFETRKIAECMIDKCAFC